MEGYSSKRPEGISNHERRLLLVQLASATAIFLTLHVLFVFWRPDYLWGVDFLAYTHVWVQSLFAVLSVLLFFPKFRLQVRAVARYLPFALWSGCGRVWVTRTFILPVALISFIAFSSAIHLLGDGYLLINELTSKTGQEPFRAPLSFALINGLHQAGQALWQSAENTYRVYSYASGVLYLLTAFAAATTVGKSPVEKSIVLAFLITPGYMQIFFGYVENYPLCFPVLLLYIVLGLKTENDRMPLYIPAIVLGFLLGLHRAFGVFAPSILVLAYRQYRDRSKVDPILNNALTTMAALCCVPLTTGLVLGFSGVGVGEYVSMTREREFLPLLEETGIHAQYRMFSLPHLLDYSNLILLSTPVAGGAAVLFTRKLIWRQPFVSVSTAVPLVFAFLANPGIGTFRDWDIFSLPAVPLTVLTVMALLTRIREPNQLFHGAFLLCGAAVLHTFSWVSINANAGAAEARFVQLADGLRGEAGVYAWVGVGNIQRQERRYESAVHAYKRALDASPGDPNRWLHVGAVYREMGRSDAAIEYFKKAQELRPGLAIPYMNLGAAYSDLGQFDTAINYAKKAIALNPNLAAGHLNLGAMYRKTGQVEKAIKHLERASRLRPQDALIHEHLAECYVDAGQNEKAIRRLEIANTLRPRQTRTLVNLGVAYGRVGQNAKAIELLKQAIAIRPDLAAAYANLGLIYKYQDRYEHAIEQFEKALELQGDQANAMAYLNIGDTYYQIREYDEAIPYFQKAIQLNPDDANAHLLLGLSYRALNLGHPAGIYLKKTLEIEPDHPQAAQIRLWLERASEQR